MIPINRQQILNRYDTLSENLKQAGFSPFNTKIIYQISSEQHLTDDKIPKISELVGYVIFGFLHPEDLAKEIRNTLNLNPEIANTIAAEIDRKIFALIRADLEKVYQPPTEETLDLRAKVEPPTEVEIPKTEPIAVEIPKAEEPKVVVEETQSKEVQPPEVKPQFGEVEPPKIGVGETEPLIIHKEAEFKPISETKKSLGGLFGFLRKGKEEERKISPVKAQVEIGELKEESEKREVKSEEQKEPSKVRVVHYTEFPTPVSPFGTIEESEKRKEEREERKVESEQKKEIQYQEVQPQKINGQYGEVKLPKVEEKIQPLDLRKPPAATEAALAARPEESKSTKPEEEEIINLSSFK